jgi:ribosomal protein L7/L12
LCCYVLFSLLRTQLENLVRVRFVAHAAAAAAACHVIAVAALRQKQFPVYLKKEGKKKVVLRIVRVAMCFV